MGAIGEDGVRVINDEVVRRSRRLDGRGGRGGASRARRTRATGPSSVATGPRFRSRAGPRGGGRRHRHRDRRPGRLPGGPRAGCGPGRARGACRSAGCDSPRRRRGRRAGVPGDARALLRRRPVLRGLLPDLGRGGRGAASRGQPPGGRRGHDPAARAADPRRRDEEVDVHAGPFASVGISTVPEDASGWSSSPTAAGAAATAPATATWPACSTRPGSRTLLFDLLTPDEEHDRARLRHPAVRRPARQRHHWLEAQPERRPARRLFRCQHRRRCGPVGRRRARRVDRGGRVSGRTPRPRRSHARRRAARRRCSSWVATTSGARAQPSGAGPAPLREPSCRGARRDPPLRGAGSLGRGVSAGEQLVPFALIGRCAHAAEG